MIPTDAGIPTTGFCALFGVPERTWRRHRARARTGAQVKGPWPRPARERVREAARRHALVHPAWVTFGSVEDLDAEIRIVIDGWNERSHPFVWTSTAEQVLRKANPKRTSKTDR